MKIWKYESYDDYVKAQTKANVKKIKKIWVQKSTIKQIYNRIPMAANILCHGTRNAAEQKYFSDMYQFPSRPVPAFLVFFYGHFPLYQQI